MASDFPTGCLCDVASVHSGFAFKSKDMGSTGVPIIKIKNVTPPTIDTEDIQRVDRKVIDGNSRIEKFALDHGDILIAMTGATVGKVGRMPQTIERFYLNQRVGKVFLDDPEGADYDFIYYVLSQESHVRQMFGIAYGSAQANISGSLIETLKIPLPPVHLQRRIAHILGTLDDKVELNRRMNRTLEKMAAAMFKSWFIDFDPVRAKAEGRDTGLPAEIADLFPDSFEGSELGEIPRGWTLKPIGEAVRCVGGATPSTKNSQFWDGGRHPFVTPKDMSSLQSPVILDSERHITDAGVEKISSKQLPIGTVILSSRAPIGYLGVAAVPVSVNQGVIAMICDGDLPNLYVLHWTAANMALIKSRAGGTTFAEISKKNFRPIPALVPDRCVLDAFMADLASLYERITLNVRQNRRLAGFRDTLLPKLLCGEIELPEAEAVDEEVSS